MASSSRGEPASQHSYAVSLASPEYQKKTKILTAMHDITIMANHITSAYKQRIDSLLTRLKGTIDQAEGVQIEKIIHEELNDWEAKIQALGGSPKGEWRADFDSGDGYFCWKFPETKLVHWHRYHDGATKKISVDDWLLL